MLKDNIHIPNWTRWKMRSKNYQLSSQHVTPGRGAMWQTSLALNKCASCFSHNSLAFKERTVSTVCCCSIWHFHKVNTLVFLFTPKPWLWGSTELFGIKSNCLVFCNLMGLYEIDGHEEEKLKTRQLGEEETALSFLANDFTMCQPSVQPSNDGDRHKPVSHVQS